MDPGVAKRTRALRILVLLAWMGLITYWSSQGSLPIDTPDVANVLHNFQHRLAHVLAFGLMGLLGRWAFDGWPRAAFLAVLAVALFGVTDEFHQSFVPGRRAAIDDWALDTASAALAVYVFARLRQTRARAFLYAIAPLAVGVAFAAGLALAARPALAPVLSELGLRAAGS
jgi:VanZ family protein